MDDVSYLDPESINGLNLYAYCNNNPVMYSDRTGCFPFFVLTAIIMATLGFGITTTVDYFDDGKVFNGSFHWGWYLGATLLGAAIGAGVGMAISHYATGSVFSSVGKVWSGLFGKTTLYRSVGVDELADIQKTNKFNLGNGTMEVKQFGLSLDETKVFANFVKQKNIVCTKIPNRIFYRLDHTIVDVGIFKSGIVTVESTMLNIFNNSVYYIMFL